MREHDPVNQGFPAEVRRAPSSGRFVRRALLGFPLFALFERTEAAGDGICKSVKPSEFVSKHSCVQLACGNNPDCLCVQTLGHNPMCLIGFDPDDPADCPSKDECGDRRPCPPGKFCAKTTACCGTTFRRCLKRCPTKATG
ncbi:MAG: hypothetical protein H0U10_03670 [Chloroflexia bacterium]|nr:hypothetical protein [Chloroflexia bacterium]